MKQITSSFIPKFLVAFFLTFIFHPADAIPAFARKYQISCQVCHSPAPRLKPFGDTFASAGYRLTEYESPRYFIPAGDDKLSLFREFPIAARFDGITSIDFRGGKKVNFGAPFILKLMSGGELSEKLSYYFYFLMSEAGEMVGIEDAFIMYRDLLGSGINVYAGQFQVCDPIYKRENRLTIEDVRIITTKPGNSTSGLTYDRGFMFDYEIPDLKTQIIAEILNGSGIGPAGEELMFDRDKYKNVMGKISQPIGEYLDLGFFGYTGKEIINELPGVLNRVNIFGPGINLDFNEKLMINLQYAKRIDSDVFIEESNSSFQDVSTQGAFAEIIYNPKGDMSNWYFTGLLNWVDSDLNDLDYKSATLHIGYIARRNVRLFSEFSWIASEEKYGKLSVGFMSAF